MSIPEIIYKKEDGIAIITINRPETMNAMTTEMYNEFQRLVEVIQYDDDVKALIITGEGRAFCAGSDVVQRLSARLKGQKIESSRREKLEPVGYLSSVLSACGKPIIAAINGVAAGAGLSISLLCDIRIASEKARFGAGWVRVGLIPDLGSTYSLPRIIGSDRALEMFWTGDIIDAKEAEQIGLVTRIVPHDELMDYCVNFAKKLANGPSMAIELIKRAVQRSKENDLDTQLDYESYALNICRQTKDHKEGVTAYMEKRQPDFKGE